jgi:hypothetical protein
VTSELATVNESAKVLEQVVIGGDLANLSPAERVRYYQAVCESIGVNPLTKPFEYIRLNGKLQLYALRGCTDQLRANRCITVQIISSERMDDVWIVRARASMPSGRFDESIGAVTIAGLKGDALANALMKAETKAKRRATLALVGLGMLDETETETIPGARVEPMSQPVRPARRHGEPVPAITAEELAAANGLEEPPRTREELEAIVGECQPITDTDLLEAGYAELNRLIEEQGRTYERVTAHFAKKSGHSYNDASLDELQEWIEELKAAGKGGRK